MRPLTSGAFCNVKVDGVHIVVAASATVAQACGQAGVPIPTLCHHASLAPTATCNTCLVSVNDQLVRACIEPVVDDMQIFTRADGVVEQRRQALSVLLTHHPLQCSVCPQSGGCELQSHVAAHAPVSVTAEAPTAPLASTPEAWLARPDLCVACTRCVRFADEVLQQPVLALSAKPPFIVQLAPSRPSGYAGSFSDVCPVGVFAAARKPGEPPLWALESHASICPGCATGCTIWLDESQQRVHKVRARGGRGFLCDDGYAIVPKPTGRVVVPMLNGQPAAWDNALDHASRLLLPATKARSLGVVVSAELPCETLAAVVKACAAWGLPHVYWAKHAEGDSDNILRHPDKNPNTAGLKLLLGAAARDVALLQQDISAGAIDALWILGAERVQSLVHAVNAAPRITACVFASAYEMAIHQHAPVVLPLVTWAETHGSFVNHNGRAQSFKPAHAPAGDALSGWQIVSHIAARMETDLGLHSLSDVRREMLIRGVALPQSEAVAGRAVRC